MLAQRLAAAAQRKRTGITLQHLLEFGRDPTPETLVTSATFLQHELPIRLAHRVAELADLPLGLSDMPSIRQVRSWYEESFDDLEGSARVVDMKTDEEFTETIHRVKDRHAATLITMAKGVHELKTSLATDDPFSAVHELPEIQAVLDDFYMSRIGIRLLIGQHVALHEPPQPGWVGVICERTSPYDVALQAADQARFMCTREYGDAPDVEIHGRLDLAFPFLPSHLHHILFELLKNSTRAVCETHGEAVEASGDLLPPVRVVIADGEDNEDVCILVSDEGGGIPRSAVHNIWHYTAFERLSDTNVDFADDTPLAGLGYGLPISRLFARYFGGDLRIISMEGYGTDAYLHLKRVSDVVEPL